MFFSSFQITLIATLKISLIAFLGFLFVKKDWISEEGLNNLTVLVINLTLPLFIFSELIKRFDFRLYSNWWFFPLLSALIAFIGLLSGYIFFWHSQGQEKSEFLSLLAFQNSGYLPLSLAAVLLKGAQRNTLFIYIFLYLLGFNFLIWTLGVYLLSNRAQSSRKNTIFNAPVLATIISLLVIFLGLDKLIPDLVFEPLEKIGNCTVPLGLLIVGGNLARLNIEKKQTTLLINLITVKLIILPLIALSILIKLKAPFLLGFLILMEFSMPSATTLTIIARRFSKEEKFISAGVFWSHIVGLFTIPLFLGIFYSLNF